tara:strand:- start:973 stop:1197 length:225 start_codon:yes stop_codon:yes gene_type:complete
MKEFLLVLSMWGNTGTEWVYMGNQYVNNNLMTMQQCEFLISEDQWTKWTENEYYKIQFDCFHKDAEAEVWPNNS